jgi:DNA-binding transcriptional regulator YdaS (Cro superfamily)
MEKTNKKDFWNEIKISELSQKMNLSKQAVYKWQTHGIPAKRLLEVEKLTDVKRERLRPDLYA